MGAVGVAMGGAWLKGDDDQIKRDIDGVAEMGAKWMRWSWQWDAVEHVKGSFDTFRRVNIASWIQNAGMRSLGVLGYCPPFYRYPEWSGEPGSPPQPQFYDEYARYVTACVTAGKDVSVDHWEVWNEPNMRWAWYTPDPQVLGTMARMARGPARAANPEVKFLLSGLAPAKDAPPASINPVTYLKALHDKGFKNVIDAVSMHPYAGQRDPTLVASYMLTTTQWDAIVKVLHDNGTPNKKIWCTEFGFGTRGTKNDIPETQQGDMICKQIEFMQSHPNCGPQFIYNWREVGEANVGFNGFGLVRYGSDVRKPAYAVIKKLLTT